MKNKIVDIRNKLKVYDRNLNFVSMLIGRRGKMKAKLMFSFLTLFIFMLNFSSYGQLELTPGQMYFALPEFIPDDSGIEDSGGYEWENLLLSNDNAFLTSDASDEDKTGYQTDLKSVLDLDASDHTIDLGYTSLNLLKTEYNSDTLARFQQETTTIADICTLTVDNLDIYVGLSLNNTHIGENFASGLLGENYYWVKLSSEAVSTSDANGGVPVPFDINWEDANGSQHSDTDKEAVRSAINEVLLEYAGVDKDSHPEFSFTVSDDSTTTGGYTVILNDPDNVIDLEYAGNFTLDETTGTPVFSSHEIGGVSTTLGDVIKDVLPEGIKDSETAEDTSGTKKVTITNVEGSDKDNVETTFSVDSDGNGVNEITFTVKSDGTYDYKRLIGETEKDADGKYTKQYYVEQGEIVEGEKRVLAYNVDEQRGPYVSMPDVLLGSTYSNEKLYIGDAEPIDVSIQDVFMLTAGGDGHLHLQFDANNKLSSDKFVLAENGTSFKMDTLETVSQDAMFISSEIYVSALKNLSVHQFGGYIPMFLQAALKDPSIAVLINIDVVDKNGPVGPVDIFEGAPSDPRFNLGIGAGDYRISLTIDKNLWQAYKDSELTNESVDGQIQSLIDQFDQGKSSAVEYEAIVSASLEGNPLMFFRQNSNYQWYDYSDAVYQDTGFYDGRCEYSVSLQTDEDGNKITVQVGDQRFINNKYVDFTVATTLDDSEDWINQYINGELRYHKKYLVSYDGDNKHWEDNTHYDQPTKNLYGAEVVDVSFRYDLNMSTGVYNDERTELNGAGKEVYHRIRSEARIGSDGIISRPISGTDDVKFIMVNKDGSTEEHKFHLEFSTDAVTGERYAKPAAKNTFDGQVADPATFVGQVDSTEDYKTFIRSQGSSTNRSTGGGSNTTGGGSNGSQPGSSNSSNVIPSTTNKVRNALSDYVFKNRQDPVMDWAEESGRIPKILLEKYKAIDEQWIKEHRLQILQNRDNKLLSYGLEQSQIDMYKQILNEKGEEAAREYLASLGLTAEQIDGVFNITIADAQNYFLKLYNYTAEEIDKLFEFENKDEKLSYLMDEMGLDEDTANEILTMETEEEQREKLEKLGVKFTDEEIDKMMELSAEEFLTDIMGYSEWAVSFILNPTLKKSEDVLSIIKEAADKIDFDKTLHSAESDFKELQEQVAQKIKEAVLNGLITPVSSVDEVTEILKSILQDLGV